MSRRISNATTFPDFRDTIAAEWPNGFPAADISAALAEFDRQASFSSGTTLVAAAYLHGAKLKSQKCNPGTGKFTQPWPSAWLRDAGWKPYLPEIAKAKRRSA